MGRAANQVEFPNAREFVPEEFLCPISGEVMADPVIVASGQSYERSCIQAWLEQGRKDCYKSDSPLDHQLLIPNAALRSAILGWSRICGHPAPEPISTARAVSLVKNLLGAKIPAHAEDELGKMPSQAPAVVSAVRYVHSASGAALRDLSEETPARIPHSLDTSPSSLTMEKQQDSQQQHQERQQEMEPKLEPGALQQLVKKLRRSSSESDQSSSAGTIRRLAREGPVNRRLLGDSPELLEALVALLQSPYPAAVVNAAAAILNLSREPENKLKIMRAGAMPRLIQTLKFEGPEAQEHATGAIFSLALHEENRLAIGVLGAIPPLIELLKNPNRPAGAQRDAAMALYYLSLAQLNRSKMIRAGIIPIIVSKAELPDCRRDLASRGLCILSSLASSSEGRAALLEIDGVSRLLRLLASCSPSSAAAEDAEFKEHLIAALLHLSHHNIRFKPMALQANGVEILHSHLESATPRAREKILKLLNILKGPSSPGNSFTAMPSSMEPYFPRSYVRNRGDYKAESSHF